MLGLAAVVGAYAATRGTPPGVATAALACPAAIETEQRSMAIPGWAAERAHTPTRLSAIGFYDGPVSDKVELAPSTSTVRGAIATDVWAFSGTTSAVTIACSYRDTDVMLSRTLPAGVHGCTVSTNRVTHAISPTALACH